MEACLLSLIQGSTEVENKVSVCLYTYIRQHKKLHNINLQNFTIKIL